MPSPTLAPVPFFGTTAFGSLAVLTAARLAWVITWWSTILPAVKPLSATSTSMVSVPWRLTAKKVSVLPASSWTPAMSA